jgi:hypothetical protein
LSSYQLLDKPFKKNLKKLIHDGGYVLKK